MVKIEQSIKSEPIAHELVDCGGYSKRKSERGDLIFCDMTLRELQWRCKPKKKKILKSGDLKLQDAGSFSAFNSISGKDGSANLQSNDDESYMDKPLSTWKKKSSKKTKSRCIRIKEHKLSFIPAVSLQATVHQQSLENIRVIDKSVNVNIENSETDCTDREHLAHDAKISTYGCATKMLFCSELCDEVCKSIEGNVRIEESTSYDKEIPSCIVNEVSREPFSLLPLSDKEIIGEIADTFLPQMTKHEYLCSPIVEHVKDNHITQQLPTYIHEETLCDFNNVDSGIYGTSEGCSVTDDVSCPMNSNIVTQLLCTDIDDSPHCAEIYCNGDSMMVECSPTQLLYADIDDSPHCAEIYCDGNNMTVECSPTLEMMSPSLANDVSCPMNSNTVTQLLCTDIDDSPHCAEIYCDGDSMMAECSPTLKTMCPSLSTDGQGDYSSEIRPDVSSGIMASDALESHLGVWLDCPPKRFFSTRKVLSPTSQEKLRQAADADDKYGNLECSKSELEGIKPQGEFGKKLKNSSQKIAHKGILKAPKVSLRMALDEIQSISILTQAQKIVSFSQRQMHDFEGLATKIITSMKSMKDIIEDKLRANIDSATPSTYTAEEVCKNKRCIYAL
ncbi:hypothetical protein GIB67_017491 [Kingdonia uniflora]|uniref:Uncharacterized protein n=1 Tax=Kingdonia uniflora TaxID=39325 RepID=A0A7J7M4Q9_9MAGN|nr:hypothetical protein GIB67_017491 [Kingdonia uniflora]